MEAESEQLKADAVREALGWVVEQGELLRLLEDYPPDRLSPLLSSVLRRRLEAKTALELVGPDLAARWQAYVSEGLRQALDDAATIELLEEVRQLRPMATFGYALAKGDKLAPIVQQVLALGDRLDGVLAAGDAGEFSPGQRS